MFAVSFKQTERDTVYSHGRTLLASAASAALSLTMFGIWSVIGEVLESERVRFNSLLCLVP